MIYDSLLVFRLSYFKINQFIIYANFTKVAFTVFLAVLGAKDNYSLGCQSAHLNDNGIFTNTAFSLTKNSFGSFPDSNKGTASDLIVKAVTDGSNALKATDLFTSPNPPCTEGSTLVDQHKAPDDIYNALKYKTIPAVLQNVGDKRWMSSDPRSYYDNL